MKLRALIERLEEIDADLRAGLGDDVEPEVVAAYQPSWPLTGEIVGGTVLEEDDAVLIEDRPVVWLAISGHPENLSPYAPRAVWEQAT